MLSWSWLTLVSIGEFVVGGGVFFGLAAVAARYSRALTCLCLLVGEGFLGLLPIEVPEVYDALSSPGRFAAGIVIYAAMLATIAACIFIPRRGRAPARQAEETSADPH